MLTATQRTFARALLAIGMAGSLSCCCSSESCPGHGLGSRVCSTRPTVRSSRPWRYHAAVVARARSANPSFGLTGRLCVAGDLRRARRPDRVRAIAGRPPGVRVRRDDGRGRRPGRTRAWALATRPTTGESRAARDPNALAALPHSVSRASCSCSGGQSRSRRAYAQRAAVFPTIADFCGPRGLDFVTTDGLASVAIADVPAPLGAGGR